MSTSPCDISRLLVVLFSGNTACSSILLDCSAMRKKATLYVGAGSPLGTGSQYYLWGSHALLWMILILRNIAVADVHRPGKVQAWYVLGDSVQNNSMTLTSESEHRYCRKLRFAHV
ncbi:hypothetical protein L226DRAFT_37074 [Lentinus tigrinus ALCF2SS1-7]|uniref:uncharacterized protein n=1 Tax=Lentinus tigrinus ALCF2SS1-7 TaxID=1328758 RepID=UPI0011661D6D|nr:hypothetical protein L226DRAFT_37074 [Lentinus tigrinus ALCF2SS1-7]